VEAMNLLSFDLVLMDYRMPSVDGYLDLVSPKKFRQKWNVCLDYP
jgi:CheY-like chemotaxis protein